MTVLTKISIIPQCEKQIRLMLPKDYTPKLRLVEELSTELTIMLYQPETPEQRYKLSQYKKHPFVVLSNI
jgi:hypothetical protein